MFCVALLEKRRGSYNVCLSSFTPLHRTTHHSLNNTPLPLSFLILVLSLLSFVIHHTISIEYFIHDE